MEEQKKIKKEIDILNLVVTLIREWRTMMVFGTAFMLLGVLVALCTPREYTAETILAPEMSSGGLGLSSNLADMASTFGINLDKKSSVDAIYPELYPDIFASPDFILQLFDIKVRSIDNDEPRTLYHYVTRETRLPFWTMMIESLKNLLKKEDKTGKAGGADPYRISRTDAEICEGISGAILCLVDKKTSEIQISYTAQDPLVATIVVDTLQRRLQQYITAYRTQKARNDYEYYKNLSNQAKRDFERARDKYTSFSEATTNAQLVSYVQKGQELENDMQLKYDSYKGLFTQMRQAEAKIQENTPAFTIIQSPRTPHKPSSRPRTVTVLLFIFLGGMAGAAWVLFIRERVTRLKQQEKSSDQRL